MAVTYKCMQCGAVYKEHPAEGCKNVVRDTVYRDRGHLCGGVNFSFDPDANGKPDAPAESWRDRPPML